jgi:hypothetical protein
MNAAPMEKVANAAPNKSQERKEGDGLWDAAWTDIHRFVPATSRLDQSGAPLVPRGTKGEGPAERQDERLYLTVLMLAFARALRSMPPAGFFGAQMHANDGITIRQLRQRRQISAPARRQSCRSKQELTACSIKRTDSFNLEQVLSTASPEFACIFSIRVHLR